MFSVSGAKHFFILDQNLLRNGDFDISTYSSLKHYISLIQEINYVVYFMLEFVVFCRINGKQVNY